MRKRGTERQDLKGAGSDRSDAPRTDAEVGPGIVLLRRRPQGRFANETPHEPRDRPIGREFDELRRSRQGAAEGPVVRPNDREPARIGRESNRRPAKRRPAAGARRRGTSGRGSTRAKGVRRSGERRSGKSPREATRHHRHRETVHVRRSRSPREEALPRCNTSRSNERRKSAQWHELVRLAPRQALLPAARPRSPRPTRVSARESDSGRHSSRCRHRDNRTASPCREKDGSDPWPASEEPETRAIRAGSKRAGAARAKVDQECLFGGARRLGGRTAVAIDERQSEGTSTRAKPRKSRRAGSARSSRAELYRRERSGTRQEDRCDNRSHRCDSACSVRRRSSGGRRASCSVRLAPTDDPTDDPPRASEASSATSVGRLLVASGRRRRESVRAVSLGAVRTDSDQREPHG